MVDNRSSREPRSPRCRAKWQCMILLVPLALALPAAASKPVTVAKLDRTLTAAVAAHRSDAEVAHRIGGMVLSERLTEATLDRMAAHLAPGSQTELALRLLADQSAFLDPPASELPAKEAPDNAAQQTILAAARSYVALILPRVPELLARESTLRYDNSPQMPTAGGWPVRAGLHLVDHSSREVSIATEQSAPAQASAEWRDRTGLVSGGEFASTLSMIVSDTAHGKIGWSRWEQTSAGLCAVFHFAVPKSASHFDIVGTFERQAPVVGVPTHVGGTRGWITVDAQPNGTPDSNISIVRSRPGYHGSLWLDPESGTVLRITIEADGSDSEEFQRAAIMVQYGAVEIGGIKYTCPVRSLALSTAVPDSVGALEDAPSEWINDTLYTDYSFFVTTIRTLGI